MLKDRKFNGPFYKTFIKKFLFSLKDRISSRIFSKKGRRSLLFFPHTVLVYILSLVCAGLFSLFIIFYSLYIPFPTAKNPLIFYFSEKRCDLKRTLIAAIKKGKESVHLYTYALTDPEILSLLKKKAEGGLAIHLYYHQKATPPLEALELKNIHLHPYKGKGLMHEKIWIVDQKLIFLGSTNLTPSSLKMHDNTMVGLYAPTFGKALIEKQAKELQLTIGNYFVHYFSLPSPKGLETVLNLLEGAKKKVSAALFTFTHPQLVEKFLEIHKRGIDISLTLDGTTARGASKKAYDLLTAAGISVKTSQGLQLHHHKWACIDQKIWIIGSANWTKAAFNKNKDYIIIIKLL